MPGRIGPRGGISAETYADFAKTPENIWDFFGVKSSSPAITKVQGMVCTGDDIAKAPELDRLRFLISRQPKGPSRVDTAMIEGAGHLYVGFEDKVAETLTDWTAKLPAPSKG